MTPKTAKGAVEKLYRIRQYLNAQIRYGRLTLPQMSAANRAMDILNKAQRKVVDNA